MLNFLNRNATGAKRPLFALVHSRLELAQFLKTLARSENFVTLGRNYHETQPSDSAPILCDGTATLPVS